MKVIKRNGTEVDFDKSKIIIAIQKAKKDTPSSNISDATIEKIADYIEFKCSKYDRSIDIEEIQDMVENSIMSKGEFELARNYVRYRYQRSLNRNVSSLDERVMNLIGNTNEVLTQENANKNPMINATQRDYMAGEISKDLCRKYIFSDKVNKAHDEGIIHVHDRDYAIMKDFNCCLVNLEDMLQNGTVITKTKIDTPHSFSTACNVATQIIAQIASNQYGGQTITLSHLAPFVDVSRKKIAKELEEELSGLDISEEKKKEIVESRVKKDITRGVQTIQYQILTLMTTNGQTPFVSVAMYLGECKDERTKKDLAMVIEEVLNQRIQGIKNEKGAWITPVFPKLLYILEEDNIHENSPYWYLTELAAKCTAKRMVPDYISEKVMKELKNGQAFPCMGCRSFLSDYVDPETGKHKFYGRFNLGVVTLNLVDVALSSGKDMNKFWELMEERSQLIFDAHMSRINYLKGTTSDCSPIHWQYGGIARLKPGEKIDKLFYNGYSSVSYGYAGLYECVKYMTGKSHTDPEAIPFAKQVLQFINDKCNQWKEETKLGYSVYGSPIENSTYRFAKSLQRRFGKIEGITDKNYVTNSFHVNVTEKIDAFSKLKFESQFQELSSGGSISYIECPDMQKNIPAVLKVIQYIYDNTMYAELNSKSDYCMECGYDGEVEMKKDESGKLYWQCPNCGNTDLNRMSIVRRVCGYLSSNTANQGRMADIHDRVLHL